MKKTIIYAVLFLLPVFLHSQTTFDMVYDMEEGYENNNGLFLAVAEDGIVCLSGTLCNHGAIVISCMELFKINFEGELLWTQRFKDTINHMVPGGAGVVNSKKKLILRPLSEKKCLGNSTSIYFYLSKTVTKGTQKPRTDHPCLGGFSY